MPSDETRRENPLDPLLDARADSIDWAAIEAIVHCDPAGRGLASFRAAQSALDAGQLRTSAVNIAQTATAVGIVTGFPVQTADDLTAETDGPPGAMYLARALAALGSKVFVISDSYAMPLLRECCRHWQMDPSVLIDVPFESDAANDASRARNGASWDAKTDLWVEQFFATGPGRELSHLIAIERPGPSHTIESIDRLPGASVATRERFLAEVPAENRNLCHNMRGQSINHLTAKTHRLFEWIAENRLPIVTVGIGDGGNEIGMGRFAWQTLVEGIARGQAGRIACRIATDHTLVAGVSNWGAYALALGICAVRGQIELARDWTAANQQQLIESLVANTHAVDGLTRRREATVDGLPLNVYLQPLTAILTLLQNTKA